MNQALPNPRPRPRLGRLSQPLRRARSILIPKLRRLSQLLSLARSILIPKLGRPSRPLNQAQLIHTPRLGRRNQPQNLSGRAPLLNPPGTSLPPTLLPFRHGTSLQPCTLLLPPLRQADGIDYFNYLVSIVFTSIIDIYLLLSLYERSK